jgi:uncharacterized protein (DUF58 family)
VTRRPPWPAGPERFPAPFRSLLQTILAQPTTITAARDDRQRARRAVLSQSGTFVGHRPYVRGDDLRRIDWAAYARTGSLFVKQLEEEERRAATLLLDLSPSLLAGEIPRRMWALRIAAVVGGMSLVHLDSLTVVAPGAGAAAVATFAGVGMLAPLLQHLDALPVATVGPDDAVALALQRGAPGRVHWISDFAVPADYQRPLLAMRRRGARVTGWLPELPSDREPPAGGYLRVVDPETSAELAVPIDGAFAQELRRQLKALARQQDGLFAQAGAPLVRWNVPDPGDLRVAAYKTIVARCAG